MGRSLVLLFLLTTTFFAVAADQVVDVENRSYWLCKNKKEVRTIRVQIRETGVCNTLYAKHGDEALVGSGKNHESCVQILNNIKTNLEKSDWACRDVTNARITASSSNEE